MLKRHIAVYHPEGNMGDNANLTAIIHALLEVNFFVDYIHYSAKSVHSQHGEERLRDVIIPRNLPLDIARSHYDVAIGVDDGVVAASSLWHDTQVPFVFLSYENFFRNEARNMRERQWVERIQAASRNASFAISQDTLRANSLKEEYGLTCPVLCIPVGGEGEIAYTRSEYLRNLCGIPDNKKILLHMGSVQPWTMVDWLVDQSFKLPDDWVLVIHGRYGLQGSGLPPPHEKLYYSSKQIADDGEFRSLVQSADCCVAMYRPQDGNLYTGRNVAEISLSSTKMATAWRHGIPVLVNSMPGIVNAVETSGAGYVIDAEDKMPFDALRGLDKISSECCHAAFRTFFDFANYKYEFLESISRIFHDRISENAVCPRVLSKYDMQNEIFSMSRKELFSVIMIGYKELLHRIIKKIGILS